MLYSSSSPSSSSSSLLLFRKRQRQSCCSCCCCCCDDLPCSPSFIASSNQDENRGTAAPSGSAACRSRFMANKSWAETMIVLEPHIVEECDCCDDAAEGTPRNEDPAWWWFLESVFPGTIGIPAPSRWLAAAAAAAATAATPPGADGDDDDDGSPSKLSRETHGPGRIRRVPEPSTIVSETQSNDPYLNEEDNKRSLGQNSNRVRRSVWSRPRHSDDKRSDQRRADRAVASKKALPQPTSLLRAVLAAAVPERIPVLVSS
mmetsp:Transcript_102756/g.209363  ORF Transcript_102756/g.209363 Transcript_102756/m.209363 type:complete len:260 (-) Transcript_102756:397-1176(-)